MAAHKGNTLTPIMTASVISIIVCMIIYQLPASYVQDTLILLFTAMSALYLGAAIHGKSLRNIIIEAVFSVFMFTIAITSLYTFMLIVGAGFFLLAIWSLLHFFYKAGVDCGKSFALGFFIVNIVFLLYIVIFLLLGVSN